MKTAEQIYGKIRDAFIGLNSTITNFNVGSRIRSLFEAVALAIEELWFYADRVYRSLFVVTATGEDLDLRAQELGLQRYSAQKATGIVKFTGEDGTSIPAGTTVSTDPSVDPVVEFITLEDAVISGGVAFVKVEAKEAGLTGNVEAGKITYLPKPIEGVSSVTNPSPTSGGLDEEDDESLRKRCVLRWYSLSYGATENALRSWALEVPGVAEAKVVSAWQGPGTAKVLVWSKNTEGKLVPATDDIIEAVQAIMDERRPVTTQITVAKPEGTLVNVVIEIACKEYYNYADVAEGVKSAVKQYFDSLNPGEDVLIAKLIAVAMAVEGVENVKVDSPAHDISVSEDETAILGKCVVYRLTLTRYRGGYYAYTE